MTNIWAYASYLFIQKSHFWLWRDWAKKNSVLLYPSASVTVFSEKTVSEKFPKQKCIYFSSNTVGF